MSQTFRFPVPTLLIVALGIYLWIWQIFPRLPIPEGRVTLAKEGVEHNWDWGITIRRIEGADMALVPAGCFLMGSTDLQLEDALDSCDRYYGVYGCQEDFRHEQPDHLVCFDRPYWIDVLEVTNWRYGSSSSTNLIAMYRGPNWPRETVTWEEANDFCTGRGARLPTEAEWEYAARGPDSWIYPWGNDYNNVYLDRAIENPSDVGRTPEGDSWIGAKDLGGSISEWVSDWYGPYPVDPQINPSRTKSGTHRITRGGNWFSFAAFFMRGAHRERKDPEFASSTLGFRCARDFQ